MAVAAPAPQMPAVRKANAAPVNAEYRSTRSEYAFHKAAKYKRIGHTSDDFEALAMAFNKERGRMDDDHTNSEISAALINFADGSPNSSVTVNFLGEDGQRLCKLAVCSRNRDKVTVVHRTKTSKTFSIHAGGAHVLPLMGTFEVAVKDTARTGADRKFLFSYEIPSDDLQRMCTTTSCDSPVPLLLRVPLYLASEAKSIVRAGVSVTDMIVGLDCHQGKPRLRGARFVTYTRADEYEMLYAKRMWRMDHPTYAGSSSSVVTLSKTQSASMSMPFLSSSGLGAGNNSIAPLLDELVGKHAARSACGCSMNSCTCKDRSTRRPGFAWSLSHREKLICCTRGNEPQYIGHIGENLVCTAVIRHLMQKACNAKHYWTDDMLHNPSVVRECLVGKPRLLAALDKLYEAHGRVPTIAELCSHTSGLPALGSMDVEMWGPQVEAFMPVETGKGEPLTADSPLHERIARMLEGHVHLICAPGAIVEPSSLGIALLVECVPESIALAQELAKELGMGSTTFAPPAEANPGDELYKASRHFVSTTNDLCQFAMGIERSHSDPQCHQYLAMCQQALWRMKVEKTERTVYGISMAGTQTCTVRVKTTALKTAYASGRPSSGSNSKISLTVSYKIGEHPESGTSIVVYCPALNNMCVSAFVRASAASMFSSRSHKECGYGKMREDKVFRVKHFVKQLIVKGSEALAVERGSAFEIDSVAEMACCRTPHRPPRSDDLNGQLASATSKTLPDGAWEAESGTAWGKMMSSSLFSGSGVPFYPLMPTMRAINELSRAKGVSLDENTVKKLAESTGGGSIRVTKDEKAGIYYLHDSRSGVSRAMLFDRSLCIRCGVTCASKNSIYHGGFRLMPLGQGAAPVETLLFHAIPTLAADSVCLAYGGVYYASETLLDLVKKSLFIASVDAQINSAPSRSEKLRNLTKPRSQQQQAQAPQAIASEQQQQRIEGPGAFWGGFAGGVVGGALLSGVARPYPYAYGAYPYRPYYYGPPPPYYY